VKVKIFSSDFILFPDGLKEGYALVVDTDSGEILDIIPANSEAEYHSGILTPGFINMHCHLELSPLKGMIPEKTGMAGFIKAFMQAREHTPVPDTEYFTAIARSLYTEGMQAIADISNDTSTFALKNQKAEHIPYFYTFCEIFSLNPIEVESKIKSGLALKQALPEGQASLTWHAPYSMSPELIRAVSRQALTDQTVMSLHFMESEEELELFTSVSGPLAKLFSEMGIQPLPPSFGRSDVLDFMISLIPPELRVLWVHVTEIDVMSFERICRQYAHRAWCLCPSANMYIHGKLPPAELFLKDIDNVTVGTDSLAGNHQLSILHELKLLSENFPSISTRTLLQWSSQNAAAFMGWEHLGRFEPTCKPGILRIFELEKGRIASNTCLERII